MSAQSRRTFLVGAGSTAAVGAPAVAVTPAAAYAGGPIVVYVTDAAKGRMTVMRGDDEVVIRDPELAQRIAKAVH
jgi:hypothetical protein